MTKPKLGDILKRPVDDAELDVAPDGSAYVNYGSAELLEAGPTVRISRDGHRLGVFLQPKKGSSSTSRVADPSAHWQKTLLLSSSNQPLAEVDRWPDLKWLPIVPDTVVSPDGQLLVSGPVKDGDWYGERRFAIYSHTGAPLSLARLPLAYKSGIGYSFAFDGRYLYAGNKSGIYAVDRRGKLKGRLAVPRGQGENWWLVSDKGGFAIFDGRATLYRYKVP